MSEEILINVAPMETRVALLDNGVLQEVYLERFQSKGPGLVDSDLEKGLLIKSYAYLPMFEYFLPV